MRTNSPVPEERAAGREVRKMFVWRSVRDPFSRHEGRFKSETDALGEAFSSGRKPWLRPPWQESRLFPLLNVRETAEAYTVTMPIPGIATADLEIKLDRDTLIVNGVRRRPDSPEEAGFHLRERACGEFRRSLALNANVDRENIRAIYRKGVLEVTLPKQKEKSPSKIRIWPQ